MCDLSLAVSSLTEVRGVLIENMCTDDGKQRLVCTTSQSKAASLCSMRRAEVVVKI
jgi:hypothetical protein